MTSPIHLGLGTVQPQEAVPQPQRSGLIPQVPEPIPGGEHQLEGEGDDEDGGDDGQVQGREGGDYQSGNVSVGGGISLVLGMGEDQILNFVAKGSIFSVI